MTKKTLWILAATLVLLLLTAGHIYYWYLPRERPGRPAPDSMASRLLARDDYAVALWMPYPHQNLGQLYRTAGVENDALAALARLAKLPTPEVPHFGSMRVPPASELVIVADEEEERFALCAKVFPLFAAFARLSGRLADNPWLAGGEIYVEGRRLEVSWQGNWWSVGSPEFPALENPPEVPVEADPEALAVIHVRRAKHPLPSGRFYLQRRQGGLEIVSRQVPGNDPPYADLGLPDHEVFLLALAGRRMEEDEAAQAMAFFSMEDVDLPELPRVVVLHGPDGEHWDLPGESILELAGRGAESAVVEPWTVTALDDASLESGRQLAPSLGALLAADEGNPDSLQWGLWLDLGDGLAEVSRIVDVLEQVPIVPRSQVERWSDFETALEPLARHYSHLTVEVAPPIDSAVDAAETTGRLRIRLEPAIH